MSSFCHTKERVAIGTTNGEVKIYTDDNLTEICVLKDKQVSVMCFNV